MFDKLAIENFRAFEKIEIAPLHRVNLIAGGNNIGKTSVLEAIWLALQDNPFSSPETLTPYAQSLFRRSAIKYEPRTQSPPDDIDNFWKWLFFQKDISRQISIGLSAASAKDNRSLSLFFEGSYLKASVGDVHSTLGQHSSFSFTLPPPGPDCIALTAFHPSPVVDAERVNTVSVINRDEELVSYLRLIDPRIRKLKYLKLPGHQHPYVYADVGLGKGKELIPATQLGQGTSRMLGLFASLMTERPRALLIDEFENGLQHDAIGPIWSALGKFARDNDVQIFATTHSYECIVAAHRAFAENADDFAVIKLRPDPEQGIAAFVLNHADIDVAIETEMEIR